MLALEHASWLKLAFVQVRQTFWFSCLLVTLVTLVFVLVAPDGMKSSRYGDYAPQVESLRAGRGFTGAEGQVLHRYPPLYPLMLWGIEQFSLRLGLPLYTALATFATTCNAFSAALVWRIGLALGLHHQLAAAAAVLFGLHPFVLYGVLIPLSETPFITVFTAGVLFLMVAMQTGCRKWFFWSGTLIGLACLIRPIGLLAPVVFAAVVFWQFRRVWQFRLAMVGLFVAAFMAVVLPWVLWVRAKSGEWVPVSSGGPPTLRDGLSFNHKEFREKLQLPEGVARLSDAAWKHYENLKDFKSFLGFVFRQLQHDPVGVMQTFVYKGIRAWYGTDSQRANTERFNMVVSLLFLALVSVGLLRYWHHGWSGEAWLLIGAALLFWMMATLMLSIARYTTPAVAMLAPFAAWGLPGYPGQGAKGRRDRRFRPAVLWGDRPLQFCMAVASAVVRKKQARPQEGVEKNGGEPGQGDASPRAVLRVVPTTGGRSHLLCTIWS